VSNVNRKRAYGDMVTACVHVRCARRTQIIISRRILNRFEQDHARRIQLMSIYG